MKKFIREHPKWLRMAALAGLVVAVNLLFSACGGSSETMELSGVEKADEAEASGGGITADAAAIISSSGSENQDTADAGGTGAAQAEFSSVMVDADGEGGGTGAGGQATLTDSAAAGPGQEAGRNDDAGSSIYVYICGAVVSPGVYELEAGSRVFAAVDAAGGLTEKASAGSVNQARMLVDGEEIYIPSLEELELGTLPAGVSPDGTVSVGNGGSSAEERAGNGPGGPGAGSSSGAVSAEGKVNINTADAAELQKIPGVGAVRAQAIIDYRNAHGNYGSIEDLMKVSGIKQAVFDKMRDSVTVG